MRNIEVCCTSVADVIEAWYGGAVRVELCSAISCGGVTPSRGLVEEVMRTVRKLSDSVGSVYGPLTRDAERKFEVNVLVRPREGGFCYSDSEIETMLSDVRFCRESGIDGVVIGVLTPDGDVDMETCRKLIEAADGMSVTFHRAFDVCVEPYRSLEQIISLGCDRLLTSGQKPDALSGAELIRSLVIQSAGRISVMPGSGICPANILEIERITGASEFHSTARQFVSDLSLRHIPELGFDECNADGKVLRTSRNIVKMLVGA